MSGSIELLRSLNKKCQTYVQGKGKKTSYKPQRKSLVMWSIPHFPPTGATDLLQKVELKDPFETSDDGIP
ncbi:hypothetical protein AFLA_011682 [Aspergillus flavus NRRL3357]|nr:hypothetical protein AFLA_011682 [Aspergillus flavus NRRL3357]